MSDRFKSLFIFTRSEQRGVWGLVSLILIVLAVRWGILNYSKKNTYDYSILQDQLGQLKTTPSYEGTPVTNKTHTVEEVGGNSKVQQKAPRYVIDPNTANVADWMQLGFSRKQSTSIQKYTNTGAQFYKKSDLLKLYVVDEQKLADIAPWIHIKESKKKTKNKTEQVEVEPHDTKYKLPVKDIELASINLNTADTTALKKIKGIGSYYAKSIVKYRSMIGGYVATNQLDEVYGLKDNTNSLEAVKRYVWIDTEALKKKNINTCTAKELASHYYISWSVANALVSYREMHGAFQSLEDIKKSDLVSEELYSKIVPYLKLHDD